MHPKTLRTRPSSARVPAPALRPLFDTLDHRCLRQLAHDLVQAGFTLERCQWPRWAVVGFMNGLRLSQRLPEVAEALVSPAPPALRAEARHLLRKLHPHAASTLTPQRVRTCFAAVMQEPPPVVAAALKGRPASARLGHWFVAALVWGIQAGLQGNDLAAGQCLGILDNLSLGQHFIANRLVTLFRCRRRTQRATLVEMISYSYPAGSTWREVIPTAAEGVLRSLQRRGKPLDEEGWVLSGFREGLLLCLQRPVVAQGLLDELSPRFAASMSDCYRRHFGHSPRGWTPGRLVAAACQHVDDQHPHLNKRGSRIDAFERVRHLFDFAVWMGLAAGKAGVLGAMGRRGG